jgi:hypothetical protein
VLHRTAQGAVGATTGLLRPVVSLPRTVYGLLTAVLSAACGVLVACVPFSFRSSSSSTLSPSLPVAGSDLFVKNGLLDGLESETSLSVNLTNQDETKYAASADVEKEETTMRIDTSRAINRPYSTTDMHIDGRDNHEGGSSGYRGEDKGTEGERDRDRPMIQDFFFPPPFPQVHSSVSPTSTPTDNPTSFRPKEGVWRPLQLVPPGQYTSFSTSLMPLHPSEMPSPSTEIMSHSDSTPFPFLLSASSFSTFSSSDAHPSTASFACMTPNSCAPSSILPLRSKIPHSVRASLLPFGPSPTYFLASDVPTVTARPVPPFTSKLYPNVLHLTDANLTPVRSNGHSNLGEGPGTLDSDCDSPGNMLDYSDSDSESEREREREVERERERDREMDGDREREGDQGYLTASDGEEGKGDDERKGINCNGELGKPTGSDRISKESPANWEGLSTLSPKQDGRSVQSPQRARTVRTVVMKKKMKGASVTGRSVKDREEDKDRPFFHIPQAVPSSSGQHTHAHIPQSPGRNVGSPPSAYVCSEVSTDMRSVHSVRSPLRISRHSRGSGVGVSVGVGADMRGERGRSTESDDMRVRREGRVKKVTDKEYGTDTAKNGVILGREREGERERYPCDGDRKGGMVHTAEGRSTVRGDTAQGSSPEAPKGKGKGSMWHTSGQKHSVKIIPTGHSIRNTRTLPSPSFHLFSSHNDDFSDYLRLSLSPILFLYSLLP